MAAFRFPGIRPAYSLARRIFFGRSLETDGHRRILGFGGDCRHHRHCSGHFGPRGQRRRRRGGRGRKAHLLDHWLCEQHTAVPPTPVPPTSVPYCDLYPLSCITLVRPTAVPPNSNSADRPATTYGPSGSSPNEHAQATSHQHAKATDHGCASYTTPDECAASDSDSSNSSDFGGSNGHATVQWNGGYLATERRRSHRSIPRSNI